MDNAHSGEMMDSVIRLRNSPVRPKDFVRIGCGAGFAGDRPSAALKLLKATNNLHYLVLECLAERTFIDRYEAMMANGMGYDPRISAWMEVLLPEATSQGVCIITNMGAMDPLGAQDQVLKTATRLGLAIHVAVAYEVFGANAVVGSSTYLGAAPIVNILEKGRPDVIITTRMADASLFLGPMIFELGWNWNDFSKLAQGALAGHLLECGCQLTGGYYMHPADPHRNLSRPMLLDVSLPYVEVNHAGDVIVAKADNSGGELSTATCTQQLLYEIDDPAAYVTPDVVINLKNVYFEPLTKDKVLVKGAEPSQQQSPLMLLYLEPKHSGWRGWGEISFGGSGCKERASASDYLVRSWMEEAFPGSSKCIFSYAIGHNSLHIQSNSLAQAVAPATPEVRLRLDGVFDSKLKSIRLAEEFEGLYTNGPAGGGGITTGYKKVTSLNKRLVPRNEVLWKTCLGSNTCIESTGGGTMLGARKCLVGAVCFTVDLPVHETPTSLQALPSGATVPLYLVAHGRSGDKGDKLNISLIPYLSSDLERLQKVITKEWIKSVLCLLFSNFYAIIENDDPFAEAKLSSVDSTHQLVEVELYELVGVSALNIVANYVLDGGVNVSRRVDRHGKTLSDLVLSQFITLP